MRACSAIDASAVNSLPEASGREGWLEIDLTAKLEQAWVGAYAPTARVDPDIVAHHANSRCCVPVQAQCVVGFIASLIGKSIVEVEVAVAGSQLKCSPTRLCQQSLLV